MKNFTKANRERVKELEESMAGVQFSFEDNKLVAIEIPCPGSLGGLIKVNYEQFGEMKIYERSTTEAYTVGWYIQIADKIVYEERAFKTENDRLDFIRKFLGELAPLESSTDEEIAKLSDKNCADHANTITKFYKLEQRRVVEDYFL